MFGIDRVTLFTQDEYLVLTNWFGTEPKPDETDVENALSRLGFDQSPGVVYSLEDAAVAHILLESVEARLPQWALVDCSEENKQPPVFGRQYRDPHGKPLRKVSLVPRNLFTINWADSGPGYSWPVQYRLVWVPLFEKWVVTASADSPDAFGYCDFALGYFGRGAPIEKSVSTIIKGDWQAQYTHYEQERWAYLFDFALIGQHTAEQWADEVWGKRS